MRAVWLDHSGRHAIIQTVNDLQLRMSLVPASNSSQASASNDRRRRADRPVMDRGLAIAWLVSVAIHIVLFVIMVLLPWISQQVSPSGELAGASARLMGSAQRAKFSMATTQSPFSKPVDTRKSDQTHVKPDVQGSLTELSQPRKPDLSIVGIGTGGGEFSKYGLRAGLGARGPEFFGLGGEARAARRIVYVVDRSGSMMGIFGDVQKELKRSINGLRKSQKFHVIFYSSGPPVENAPKRLVNAIRASKDEAFDFIDSVAPLGGTEPMEAMKRAFVLKPDLIYLLSDGEIPAAMELKENLLEWNRKKRVRIFTIAYVNSIGRHLLEEIARDHDGKFRFVSEYDLN